MATSERRVTRVSIATAAAAGSLASQFNSVLRGGGVTPRTLPPGECLSRTLQRCRLCAAGVIDYDAELQFKNSALQMFWRSLAIPVQLDPLVRSPRGRGYRAVTKRKLALGGGRPRLGLIDPAEEGDAGTFEVVRCAIEPPEHGLLYQAAALELRRPYALPLVGSVNYVIVRGDERERVVILNVAAITPQVTKAATKLSKALSRTDARLAGFFLYEDRSRGRYYLGSANPAVPPPRRKIFGVSRLYHAAGDVGFLYHPLAFSQTNHSILERLLAEVRRLLQPSPDTVLFDLYCGYGLLSLSLAREVKRVTGVDLSHESIDAANANGARLHLRNARFIRSAIAAGTLSRILGKMDGRSSVVLDPPRGGTGPGVIEWIAGRGPARVIHLFCNSGILKTELERWTTSGFRPVRAVPLDMFPGTTSVEIVVLLERIR